MGPRNVVFSQPGLLVITREYDAHQLLEMVTSVACEQPPRESAFCWKCERSGAGAAKNARRGRARVIWTRTCMEDAQDTHSPHGKARHEHRTARGRFPVASRDAEKKAPFFSLSWASEKVIGNLETLLRIQCWGWRKRGRRFCLLVCPKLEYSVWPYEYKVHRTS